MNLLTCSYLFGFRAASLRLELNVILICLLLTCYEIAP